MPHEPAGPPVATAHDIRINGIASIVYGVPDVDESRRFFEDFGLRLEAGDASEARFRLPEGSSVVIRAHDDPRLPPNRMEGYGVRQIVWGVDDEATLSRLAEDLSRDCGVERSADGTVAFATDFGLAMGLKVFHKRPLVSAPEAANAPGRIVRFNQHRRWRERAFPKAISHVVFAVPDSATSRSASGATCAPAAPPATTASCSSTPPRPFPTWTGSCASTTPTSRSTT